MSSWQEPPVLDYPVPSEMMSDFENRDSGLRLTGRWYALALLALTLVLSMTTWLSASAVIPQLRAEWDLSDNAAAWLTIAVQLGFVCGALGSSLVNLSDVVSPRHVILEGRSGPPWRTCCWRSLAAQPRGSRCASRPDSFSQASTHRPSS